MFEVGDRVVCVDDGPADPFTRQGNRTDWTIPVVKGRVYTVRAVLPKHYVAGNPGYPMLSIDAGGLDVGELCVCRITGWATYGLNPARFRKLRDISQSLRELKELAINCPALVEP